MPRTRRQTPRSPSPARLLAAAAAELVERGGDLEMQAVARRAGVSVGLAYHHFGSKGGLIAAVLEDFYDRLDDTAMGRRLEGPWPERERLRIRLAADFFLKDPLSAVLLGRLHRSPEVVAVEEERFRRQVALGARNMAEGQAQGAIPADRDPELLAAMVLGGVRHGVNLLLGREAVPDPELFAEEIWRSVAGAVGLPPDPAGVPSNRRSPR